MTEPVATVEVVHGSQRTSLLRRALRRRSLWFAHASGRFDRPDSQWRHALDYYRRKAVLVTGTEAAGRDRDLFRRTLAGTDWSYAHLSGAAEGEAYATWDGGVLELVGKPFAAKLTDLTWVRSKEYGGKRAAKVHTLVLPLKVLATGKRYWVAVVHMPLDNTPQRAECWRDCCRGLVDLERVLRHRDPRAQFLPVGDWNKNLRDPAERRAVQVNLLRRGDRRPSAVTSWDGRKLPASGTHGRQVIDYAIGRAFAACELLRDLPDSDHRAFRYKTKEQP